MIALRVALATAVLTVCADVSGASEPSNLAQYRASEAAAAERERPVASEREPKSKERTPPPRPIVPPEGQQENPALRAECAWIGQRIVSLLFRDDPMTGNDFVPFYTRFGCPEAHLTQAFACVVGAGSLENDALADRIALCWADPTQRPAAPQDRKNGDTPPGDGGAADGQPGDGKAGDGTPGNAKPGQGKPGDAKTGDAKPGDAKPGDAKTGDAKPGDAKTGDAKTGDAKPGDAKPGEAKPGNGKGAGAVPPAKPAESTQK